MSCFNDISSTGVAEPSALPPMRRARAEALASYARRGGRSLIYLRDLENRFLFNEVTNPRGWPQDIFDLAIDDAVSVLRVGVMALDEHDLIAVAVTA